MNVKITRIMDRYPIFNFIAVTAISVFAQGLYLFMRPEKFTHPLYGILFQVMPANILAVLMMLAGVILGYATIKEDLLTSRFGFVLIGSLYSMIATVQIIAFNNGYVSLWPVVSYCTFVGYTLIGAISKFPYSAKRGK